MKKYPHFSLRVQLEDDHFWMYLNFFNRLYFCCSLLSLFLDIHHHYPIAKYWQQCLASCDQHIMITEGNADAVADYDHCVMLMIS